MSILELAMKDPESQADNGFIEVALSELESDIAHIEQVHKTLLVGDRADFEKARHDWLMLTKIQVAYAVSYWRNGIFARYAKR